MKKIIFSLTAVFFGFTLLVNGQTLDTVITLFNDAAEKTNKGDYQTAITDFEQLLDIAEKVGAEANDLKTKAQEQLPVLNWQVAAGLLKQKKFEEAIPLLEKVNDYSTRFNNNPALKERVVKILPQVYTAVGTQQFRDKKYPEALSLFDKALITDDKFIPAWLGKGLIYAEQEDEKKMIENLEKSIELAKVSNDEKTIETARGRLARYYSDIGDMELEAVDEVDADYSYAIEFYEKALNYEPDFPDSNYNLAVIYNKKVEFDKAIEHSKKALNKETDAIKIAAINFELGNAYSNTAQYDLACEAFKKAMVGPVEEMAQRQKEKIPGCN